MKTLVFLLLFTPSATAYCPEWDHDCYPEQCASWDRECNARVIQHNMNNLLKSFGQNNADKADIEMYNKAFGEKIQYRRLSDFEKLRLQKYLETGKDFLNRKDQ